MEINFMKRFWLLVDENANKSDQLHLNVYIFTHRDGHIFVQAYNDYNLFQQLHNEKKLQIDDEDLFEIIKDKFKDFENEDMIKIVDYILLNCGYWSDFNYKKIEFMKEYERF